MLQRLMRHADIQTTMSFYAGITAEDVAADLWRNHPAGGVEAGRSGNKIGNIDAKTGVSNGAISRANVFE